MMMAMKSISASAKSKQKNKQKKTKTRRRDSRHLKREGDFADSWELGMRNEWASFIP